MTQTTTTPSHVGTAASATAKPSARAQALNSALTPVSAPKTMAAAWAQMTGGVYRTARATLECSNPNCGRELHPGESYFDTRVGPVMCEGCAERDVE